MGRQRKWNIWNIGGRDAREKGLWNLIFELKSLELKEEATGHFLNVTNVKNANKFDLETLKSTYNKQGHLTLHIH